MKIAVIGHLCVDVVHLPDGQVAGESKTSYGGIFWAVAALANLLSAGDRVYPVFGVGAPEHDDFVARLTEHENVDPKGIFTINGPTNQVHLFYGADGQHRIECSKHISDPISFSRIKPHLDVDGILINMVSGFDITLETLDLIRMHARDRKIPLHFDFHSLTLGIGNDFTRYRRPVADWRRWSFMMNSIQMNEEELAGLTSEKLNDKALASHLSTLMANALIVTRNKRGVTLFDLSSRKPQRTDFAGIEVHAVDPTGSGDVFGAAFFAEYLKNGNLMQSVEFANRVAATKTTAVGMAGLERIQEFADMRSAS